MNSLRNKAVHFPRITISVLTIFLCLIAKTSQLASPMSLSQNRKYVNSGTVLISTASATSWNPNANTVPYNFSSFSNPVLGIFLSLNDLALNANSGTLAFYGTVASFTQTSFVLNVYSNTSSKITTLGYRYMAITLQDSNTYGWIIKTVVQTININFRTVYYGCYSNPVDVPLDKNYSFYFPNLNQYVIAFLGYNFNAPSFSFSLGIKIAEGWYKNVSSLTVTISACSDYNYYYYYQYQNITVSAIHFSLLIHNIPMDQTLPSIRSQYFYIYYSFFDSNSYTYYPYYQNFANYYGSIYGPATIVALNYTRFTGNNPISMPFSIKVNDFSINFTSSYQYNYFGVTFTAFYTLYCPYKTPYLLNDTCYDVCPTGTKTNQTQLTCSNNTTTVINKTSTSFIVQIGSILGFVCFVFILVLVIVLFLYLRKRIPTNRYNNQASLPNQNSSQVLPNDSQEAPPNISNQQPNGLETGIWLPRSKSLMAKQSKQECSLCNSAEITFKTDCNHLFHVKCIVVWSKKRNQCPEYHEKNDNKGLIGKTHRVFCRICKENEKLMIFSDLKQSYERGLRSQEFICPQCLKSF